MLNIVICEDDLVQRETLKDIIEDILLQCDINAKVDLATSETVQLKKYVDSSSIKSVGEVITAYFLDIDLKQDLTGLDLAHYIRKRDPNAYIIFVSYLHKHIRNAFAYKAFDFIAKTYQDTLNQEVEVVVRRLIDDYSESFGNGNKITLKFDEDNVVRAIPVKDFIGIKKVGETYKAYTTKGVYRYYSTLQNILDSVGENEALLRPHQSVIVNKRHITAIDKSNKKFITTNDIEFEISRRKYKEVLEEWYTK